MTNVVTEIGTALGTVLGVWAHPDDEAYLSAGLMALARRAGHRVVVVTATAGEDGLSDPPRSPAELAAVRRQELSASLLALGVTEHHFLGYRDGGCGTVPDGQAVATLHEVFTRVRPHTTVTFGPDGITGHPDHQVISAWATAAWQRAGRPGRLLYATLTPEYHAAWGPMNEQLGVWLDPAQVPCTPASEVALTIELDPHLIAVKYQALRAQWSQTAPLIARMGEDAYQRWWATEAFVEATAA